MTDQPAQDLPAPGQESPPRAEPAPADPYPRPVPRGIPLHRPPPRPRGGLGVLFAIVGVCGLGLCMLLALAASFAGAAGGSVGGQLKLTEQTVVEATAGSADKVALIEINGVIERVQGGGGLLGGAGIDMVERLRKELDAAAEDANVKAILLGIDSPGGTVTASDQIWHLITEWKKKTNRPVVVHMGALCASGGYYIASSGDELICEPTTITGSIGVILSGMNFHDLLEKYGVKDVTITSGPNKDLLSSTAPLRENHVKILQAMIDDAYGRFTQLVSDGRKIPLEQVRVLADGRIYTANQAVANKLVDSIGYREDALAAARKRGGAAGAALVRYTHQPTLADLFSGAGAARAPLGELRLEPSLLDHLATPRLMVLWQGAR